MKIIINKKAFLLIGIFIISIGMLTSFPVYGEDQLVKIIGGTGCETTSTCFDPTELEIPVGTKVIWKNEDPDGINHLIMSGSGPVWDQLFGGHSLFPGESFSYTFDTPGTFHYSDNFHPWETGVIHVVATSESSENFEDESLITPPSSETQAELVDILSRVSISDPKFVNSFGNELDNNLPENRIFIQVDLKNNYDVTQPFAIFFDVMNDNEGFQVIEDSLPPFGTLKVEFSYLVPAKNVLDAQIYIWESVDNPSALAPSISTEITVGESTPVPEEIPPTVPAIPSEPETEQKLVCGPGTHEEDGACVPDQETGGGCLIATATYGSELAPQVQKLRELRDNTLLQTKSGSGFMSTFNQFYYTFSPTIADWERQTPVFKYAVKLAITPLLSSLSILNYVDLDSNEKVLGYGISLILLNIGMYFAAPAYGIWRFAKARRK